MINEINFKRVDEVDDISGVIKDVFGVSLDISGGWGYDHRNAIIVNSLELPINEFLNMFAIIRANIEMNLTLDENERYSGINVNFIDGQQIEVDNMLYDMITYEITAIKEKDYAFYIQEYKDNYGKNKEFDLEKHFKKRKESTISIKADYWFKSLEKYYVATEE